MRLIGTKARKRFSRWKIEGREGKGREGKGRGEERRGGQRSEWGVFLLYVCAHGDFIKERERERESRVRRS